MKIKFNEKGERVHPAACRGRADHIKPPALICSPELGSEMCLNAQRAAHLAIAAALVGLAVAPLDVAEPEPGDRLLTVAEAALRLGMSRGSLYRSADALPFTVRLSAGALRFSEAGIREWIRGKTAA